MILKKVEIPSAPKVSGSDGNWIICQAFPEPGRISETGDQIIISSESVALGGLSIENSREINPGEIVKVCWKNGLKMETFESVHSETPQTFCSFEYIYFFRHNSIHKQKSIEQIRFDLGAKLAKQEIRIGECVGECVVCIPQTSIPNAKGFADTLNIPFLFYFQVRPKVRNAVLLER